MSKTQKNHSREGVFICDKTQSPRFSKTFSSIFSAYTASILKVFSYKQSDKVVVGKEDVRQEAYIDCFDTI